MLFRSWLRREQLAEPLREALALHYAYRFDPRGITGEQRRELHRQVEQWLATAGVPGQSGRKSEEP